MTRRNCRLTVRLLRLCGSVFLLGCLIALPLLIKERCTSPLARGLCGPRARSLPSYASPTRAVRKNQALIEICLEQLSPSGKTLTFDVSHLPVFWLESRQPPCASRSVPSRFAFNARHRRPSCRGPRGCLSAPILDILPPDLAAFLNSKATQALPADLDVISLTSSESGMPEMQVPVMGLLAFQTAPNIMDVAACEV